MPPSWPAFPGASSATKKASGTGGHKPGKNQVSWNTNEATWGAGAGGGGWGSSPGGGPSTGGGGGGWGNSADTGFGDGVAPEWAGRGWDNEYEEDWESDEDDEWGPGGEVSWKAPAAAAPRPSGWRGWSEEAKSYSNKGYPSAAPVPKVQEGTVRNDILNALLSHPAQNDYITQAKKYGSGPFPAHHLPKQQETHTSKKQKKKEQQQPLAKHQRHQSENLDAWGGGGGGGGWDTGGGGWGAQDPWGPTMGDGDDYDPRRVHFSPKSQSNDFWGDSEKPSSHFSPAPRATANAWLDPERDTSYSMPSKTLAHAYKGTTTPLTFGKTHNSLNSYADMSLIDSRGAALAPVEKALFGRERMAKDRIHWTFSSDKDERVVNVLTRLQIKAYDVATMGVHRFLQSRERGALFVNVDFRPSKNLDEFAYDWLTFDQLQPTRDKILQESVAFYKPDLHVIVFVFLPSKTGNSMAMWRRKIVVPNNVRLMLRAEIDLCMDGLRREDDYLVHVDEIPDSKPQGKVRLSPTKTISRKQAKQFKRSSSLPPPTVPLYSAPDMKPKKRKWWQRFF